MHLLIDDVRVFPVDAIARNYDSAIVLLPAYSWTWVYFDHDLGDDKKGTGLDVMKFMFQQDIHPPNIQLVTSNPVGKKNMADLLSDNNYVTKDGFNFKRKA